MCGSTDSKMLIIEAAHMEMYVQLFNGWGCVSGRLIVELGVVGVVTSEVNQSCEERSCMFRLVYNK